MKVLFWGTPDFALPSLRALESEGHSVVGVVTQPDKPAGRGQKMRPSPVKVQAEEEGLHEIFREAGFEWREAGCSMCLAMNPDKLVGRELCASSSNRNFKGRQGSPTGRTLLMSPAMVAEAAIRGQVADVRETLN